MGNSLNQLYKIYVIPTFFTFKTRILIITFFLSLKVSALYMFVKFIDRICGYLLGNETKLDKNEQLNKESSKELSPKTLKEKPVD